uniref:Uncharacterized protein n=1 Tax=Arundo donax TaxID=35708 RepID=A0A0A9DKS5_ARUDO
MSSPRLPYNFSGNHEMGCNCKRLMIKQCIFHCDVEVHFLGAIAWCVQHRWHELLLHDKPQYHIVHFFSVLYCC